MVTRRVPVRTRRESPSVHDRIAMTCECLVVKWFGQHVCSHIFCRHQNRPDHTRVLQLAHLVHLPIDVTRVLSRRGAVAEIVRALVIYSDLYRPVLEVADGSLALLDGVPDRPTACNIR